MNKVNKNLGPIEKKHIKKIQDKLFNYKIDKSKTKLGETEINKLIINYIDNSLKDVNFVANNIPSVDLFDEVFRPEAYLKIKGDNTVCIECKKLSDKNKPKARFKEGLSQAIIYRSYYKYVFLVLIDFTKGSKYKNKLSRKNKKEYKFIKKLLIDHRINTIIISPKIT